MKRRNIIWGGIGAGLAGVIGFSPVRMWVEKHRDLPGLRHRSSFQIKGNDAGMALALSPDASRLAVLTAFGRELQVFDRAGRVLRRDTDPTFFAGPDLAMASDGAVVMTPPGRSPQPAAMLTLVPDQPGAPIRYVQGPEPGRGWGSNGAREIAVSADGRWAIATADPDAGTRCEIVDLRRLSRTSLDLAAHMPDDRITAVGISPDGGMLAVHGTNILFVDRASGHVRRIIDAKPFSAAGYDTNSFSPDGRLYAVAVSVLIGADATVPVAIIKIFDVATGTLFRAIMASPPMAASQLTWSADGTTLAASLTGHHHNYQLMLIRPHSAEAPTRTDITAFDAMQFASRAPVFGILRDYSVDLFSY